MWPTSPHLPYSDGDDDVGPPSIINVVTPPGSESDDDSLTTAQELLATFATYDPMNLEALDRESRRIVRFSTSDSDDDQEEEDDNDENDTDTDENWSDSSSTSSSSDDESLNSQQISEETVFTVVIESTSESEPESIDYPSCDESNLRRSIRKSWRSGFRSGRAAGLEEEYGGGIEGEQLNAEGRPRSVDAIPEIRRSGERLSLSQSGNNLRTPERKEEALANDGKGKVEISEEKEKEESPSPLPIRSRMVLPPPRNQIPETGPSRKRPAAGSIGRNKPQKRSRN